MANELQYRHNTTGSLIYAVLFDAAGAVWNGVAFVNYEPQDWQTYRIAMAETPADGYRYVAGMPAAAAGTYSVEVYLQSGGTAAITDTLLGISTIGWSGSEELTVHRLSSLVDSVSQACSVLASSLGNVDSTGVGLSLPKAMEVLVAALAGKASYDATTGVFTAFGRDGTTAIVNVTLAGSGARSDSTIH